MFDDCLHDNSLLAELKEWSRFYNVPAASLGHQVDDGVVRNYPDVCKDL